MRRVCRQAFGAILRTADSLVAQQAYADSGSRACRAVGVSWQQQNVLPWQVRFQHSSPEEQIPGLEQQSSQVQESVAQRAMQDPLSALMTAAGVPLGIHLKVQQPGSLEEQQQQQQQDLQAAAAAAEQQAVPAQEGDVQEQLPELMERHSGGDTWGTTSESASRIAQRIAASNEAAGVEGLHGSGLLGDAVEEGDVHEQLAAAGMRYLNEATLAQDVEHMEEIYQLLAQVPYLDDSNTKERELRGVIAVALLGTLEEVGWALRPALAALWAGERDLGVLTGQPEVAGDTAAEDEGTAGVAAGSSRQSEQQQQQLPYVDRESREWVALESILYHIQRLEAEYGPPAAEGVEQAVAAISNSGPPRDNSWWDTQQRKQQQEQEQAERQHNKHKGS